VTDDLGAGLSSYSGGGTFSVAPNGAVAFVHKAWDRPGDVAFLGPAAKSPKVLTALNDDLFSQRRLAPIEELEVRSSKDERPIQAWILKLPTSTRRRNTR